MKNLDAEQYSVLFKRVVKALDKARYEPASCDPETVAYEILRPYKPTAIIVANGPKESIHGTDPYPRDAKIFYP